MWTSLHKLLFTGKLLTCAPVPQAKEAELKQSESAQAAALQEVRSGFQEELGRRIAEHTASQGDALQAVESHLQAERDMRTADSKVMQATIKVDSGSTCFLL